MIKTSGNKSLVQYQLSVLLLLIFALFSCKGDDDEIVGPVPSGPRDGILYVEEGGTGDGSIEEPFGSIQRALETAFRNPEFRTINVATGEYIGSPRVRSGVTINGSLDSDNEWTLSSSERTVILGSKIDSLVVGLMVRNLSRTVILNHVTIMGGNADDSGASSIGLYCQDAGDVRLNECEVISGNGMVGSAGTIGDFGSNGEDADGQNTGGSSAVGGRGGDGGVRDILQQVPGSFGEDGFCIGNANGGGLGGEVSTGENGLPGENGPAGSGSVAGNGALSQIAIEAAGPYLVFRTGNGETGLTGQYGCGGGGGSGSSSIWNPDPNFSFVGSPGGGGGSGGVPGNGGEGAEGGGCAVAVFSFASTLMLTNCTLISGDGAIGGTGGLGGQGGIGGKGGFVPSAVLVGGTGGDGGAGGAGGNGGGGNGGWSIGLANSTSTIDTTNVTIFLGQPGLGGLGDGSAASQGASGQQLPGSDLP